MNGLTFENQAPAALPAPNRADVACFVGFVARRVEAGGIRVVPPPEATRVAADYPLYSALDAAGWARRPYQAGPSGLYGATSSAAPPWTLDDAGLESLLDVPVPIESWELFDRLFAWDTRPMVTDTSSLADPEAPPPTGTTYLGAAVRSFFEQGGRRCYVVRAGDPWPLDAAEATRMQGLRQLLPGFPAELTATSTDRTSWHGFGHLFGLPDVSFVCLPDLADAVSAERAFPSPPPLPPAPVEVFVECSADEPPAATDRFVRGFAAPRCTRDGFDTWGRAIKQAGLLLQDARNGLREIQLVASVPLPARDPSEAPPRGDLLAFLAPWLQEPLSDQIDSSPGFASAFVQLAWPWLKTLGSHDLPEELEGPDAILVGALARNAFTRGAYRSAAGLALASVHDVYPPLRGEDQQRTDVGDTLIQRVSLLGPTARGMQVLSDVTTFPGEGYRQGNVNRLVSAIVRAARRLGESLTFSPSGPALWARIRTSLGALLTQLWRDGALRGRTAAEAFDVRCDRSLMTERDLEAGRVLVEVQFEAASAIEQIRVVLALSEGTASVLRAA